MRLSVDCTVETEAAGGPVPARADAPSRLGDGGRPPDPTAPDVSFIENEFGAALQSFFETIDRIERDNPVSLRLAHQLPIDTG